MHEDPTVGATPVAARPAPCAESAQGLEWTLVRTSGTGEELTAALVPPLASATLRGPGWTLEAHVLPSGHQVVLHAAGETLLETVTAGPSEAHPDSEDPAELVGLPDLVGSTGASAYTFTSDVDVVGAEELAALAVELREVAVPGAGPDLQVSAEQPPGGKGLTVVWASATRAGVEWRTWHLYPTGREVVGTASMVALRPPAAGDGQTRTRREAASSGLAD